MKSTTVACVAAMAASLLGAAPEPPVKLAGALGDRFALTVRGNFMKLDLEKDYFKPFRERTATGGFLGFGKLADAAVHLAWNGGEADVVARKEKIISFIVDNQLPDGYTGYFCPKSRLCKPWDMHEMGFIIQALVSDWELFGNRAALEAARRNADYVIDRWASLPANWELKYASDRMMTLGLGYGLARLYANTGDERYLRFVKNERSIADWDLPIVIGRDKMVYGHAYVYLGTCLEQLELYGWDPRPEYLGPTRRAMDFMVHGDGLLIDGTGGIAECWTNDQDGEGHVGETCTITFQLHVYDKLIRLGLADAALLGDMMERAVYNALFAAQSRDGRLLRYYTPLNGVRKFWRDDVYCCPNNFRRAISRLPEYVFYAKENSISANLYTECTAKLDVGSTKVAVREETDYPKSGAVKFTFDPEREASFSFKVRVPRWCRRPRVTVNGDLVTYKYRPGQMLCIPRVWRKGDVVELDFPMEVRTVRGRKRQSGRFAVMRGPVVYALDTRSVDVFKDWFPHDVQSEMSMDPNQIVYEDGKMFAVISTHHASVGVDHYSVGGRNPSELRRVELKPFEDEDNTLTYFRAPNIEDDVTDEDELFSE